MGNFPLWGIPVGIRQEEQLQVLTRPATLNSGPGQLHYNCLIRPDLHRLLSTAQAH